MKDGQNLFGTVFEKGTVIFEEGASGDSMYIIQSGAVEVFHRQGGEDVVLCILEKGEFFGEAALLPGNTRLATVKTIQRSRLICLNRETLFEKLKSDPGVTLHLLRGMIVRIHQSSQRVSEEALTDETLRLALQISQELSPGILTSQLVSTGSKQFEGILGADITVQALADFWHGKGRMVHAGAGDIIFHEGETARTMYFILKGSVEISLGSGDSKCLLTTLGPGAFFGEMAMISGCLRTATATAAKETELICVSKKDFFQEIRENPELALHIFQSLTLRLKKQNALLTNPYMAPTLLPQKWTAFIKKKIERTIALVSLSSCSGCDAVLIDQDILKEMRANDLNIIYCPMIMNQDEIPEADIIMVNGAVRLREDIKKLEEVRRKAKTLVAWGTCAVTGGVPAMANRFELEDLIEETYGLAQDTFSYYLSGKGGIDSGKTYQSDGLNLLRRVRNIENFVKVDFFIPGCPPEPGLFLNLLKEMKGEPFPRTPPVVCGECHRKRSGKCSENLKTLLNGKDSEDCLISQGVICLGFLTRGGCGAHCSRNGLPCWGCRGPSDMIYKKLSKGEHFSNIVVEVLSTMCEQGQERVGPIVKDLQQQEYGLFSLKEGLVCYETNEKRVR